MISDNLKKKLGDKIYPTIQSFLTANPDMIDPISRKNAMKGISVFNEVMLIELNTSSLSSEEKKKMKKEMDYLLISHFTLKSIENSMHGIEQNKISSKDLRRMKSIRMLKK